MPLPKRETALPGMQTQEAQAAVSQTEREAQAGVTPSRIGGTRSAGARAEAPMMKDDYWRRKEERDIRNEERAIQRDKDMAWSGLTQAAMQSIGLVQLNIDNTLEGYIALVVKATNLLLQERDKKNS